MPPGSGTGYRVCAAAVDHRGNRAITVDSAGQMGPRAVGILAGHVKSPVTPTIAHSQGEWEGRGGASDIRHTPQGQGIGAETEPLIGPAGVDIFTHQAAIGCLDMLLLVPLRRIIVVP